MKTDHLRPHVAMAEELLHRADVAPSALLLRSLVMKAAMSQSRTQTALGAFSRRLAARIGKAQANTTTARKLAILVCRTLAGEFVYHDAGADAYDRHQYSRTLRRLRQRAASLGLELVNRATGEVLAPAAP